MDLNSFGYGYSGTLHPPFEQALERTRQALAHHGFVLQAEIPMFQALKSKLGVDVPPEVILALCNPTLAYRAIQSEPHMTVLLPWNVTVKDKADHTEIAAADSRKLIEMASDPKLKEVALEADNRLREALTEM